MTSDRWMLLAGWRKIKFTPPFFEKCTILSFFLVQSRVIFIQDNTIWELFLLAGFSVKELFQDKMINVQPNKCYKLNTKYGG